MNYEIIKQLPTLGRDVKVGNLYNYLTDEIVTTTSLPIPEECANDSRFTQIAHVEYPSFLRNQKSLIYKALHVNTHIKNSIDNGNIKDDEIWFDRAMKQLSSIDDHATVVAIIRIVRRTVTIREDFVHFSKVKYCLGQGGLVTHLIDHLAYGTELFVIFQKGVDEYYKTKVDVEKAMLAITKAHLREVLEPNRSTKLYTQSASIKLTAEMSCTVYSSDCGTYKEMNSCSLADFTEFLRQQLEKPCSDCKPIHMNLRAIPFPLDAIQRAEKMTDLVVDLQLIEEKLNELLEDDGNTSKPLVSWKKETLDPVSLLTKQLKMQFNVSKNEFSSSSAAGRYSESVDEFIDVYSKHFAYVNEWLDDRKIEVAKLTSLLGCTELTMIDLAAIKNHLKSTNLKDSARVFYLRFELRRDETLERIQTMFGLENKVGQMQRFPIVDEDDARFQQVCKYLKNFSSEAEQNSGRDVFFIALVPVDETSKDGDISSIDFENENSQNTSHCVAVEADVGVPSLPTESREASNVSLYKKQQALFVDRDDEAMAEAPCSPKRGATYGILKESKQIGDSLVSVQAHRPDDDIEMDESWSFDKFASLGRYPFEKDPPISNAMRHSSSFSSAKQTNPNRFGCTPFHNKTFSDELARHGKKAAPQQGIKLTSQLKEASTNSKNPSRRVKMDFNEVSNYSATRSDFAPEASKSKMQSEECTRTCKAPAHKEIKLPSNMKLKEIYTKEEYDLGKLETEGEPSVFQMNVRKRQQTDVNLRQFDVRCPADGCRKDHKVIILMGATGCGKSTLINGMVNYIFGVEWNDPYRFKCVLEDLNDSTPANQAHSQTQLVSSYTLSWHDGMSVPFSITIIDTPGYGDTRGVKRDKAITKRIHQFLTDAEIDEIHAVCFVAASGNSRLTATQGYIINSVLSIFGNDIKDNIRLLVTFADNQVPPVVEACKESNFPVTLSSGQVLYSKFNSSVLYARNGDSNDNDNDDDDDFNPHKLFWDMGQEGFKIFFDMLGMMDGKDLTTTRQVIQSRYAIEQMLEQIEDELEVCLTKIENTEVFRKELRRLAFNMVNTKDYTMERVELEYVKRKCERGYIALNCKTCRGGKGGTCSTKEKCYYKIIDHCIKRVFDFFRNDVCQNHECRHLSSEHDINEFKWCLDKKAVKTTFHDMKREYELHHNSYMTTDQLLQCSLEELDNTKAEVFSLLDKITENVRYLQSTALNSNVLGPDDYLNMIKSKVTEEQAPGYETRLETLAELQQYLRNKDCSRPPAYKHY